MPRITIEKQVQLPWAKSLRMAFGSIRVEFRRSVLSALAIICALAFLSFVWVEADILDALRSASGRDTQLARRLMVAGRMTASEAELQRKTLLVTMSLIVCTVGISNAMAMSVTERFQQIGTMKCLGALNGFIARLFVLEALFLGMVGTLIGDAAGILLALLRASLVYGAAVLQHFPWLDVLATGGYTILVGVGISWVGAMYPAIVAARMEPVEAMRVTT